METLPKVYTCPHCGNRDTVLACTPCGGKTYSSRWNADVVATLVLPDQEVPWQEFRGVHRDEDARSTRVYVGPLGDHWDYDDHSGDFFRLLVEVCQLNFAEWPDKQLRIEIVESRKQVNVSVEDGAPSARIPLR